MVADFEILTARRFYLTLNLQWSNENVDAIFLECRGFQRTQEVIEVCEVTPDGWGAKKQAKGRVVRTKLPGNPKSGNLTLRRGMTYSISFWQWFQQVQDGNWGEKRRDATLSIYSQGPEVVARFNFSRCWPTSYKITDVNARSTEIEVEELEIAFEDCIREQ